MDCMVKNLISKLLKTKGSELGDNRITRDLMMLSIARIVSFRGTCNRGGRAGAVIAKDGRIISIGYAGSPPGLVHCIDVGCDISNTTGGCIRTQHAEANAISWAARVGVHIEGATMYCTLQPCLFCAKLIAMSGIIRVVYIDDYRDGSGVGYLISCNIGVEQFNRDA